MWFKQGISLDNSNFDMENSSSLVDVKLWLKRILESYWNKLLCKFCITVRRLHATAQSSTCATYEKCNNGRVNSKSVIELTAFIAFETGRKLNSACCNYVHSHTMHRFIIFMWKTCLDFLRKTSQEKGLIKDW